LSCAVFGVWEQIKSDVGLLRTLCRPCPPASLPCPRSYRSHSRRHPACSPLARKATGQHFRRLGTTTV